MKCIDDYINGNLKDAKKAAKRVSYKAIRDTLTDEYGRSHNAACSIADFLKGIGTFRAAADSEMDERDVKPQFP